MLTGADKTNREYVGDDVEISSAIDPNLVKLFYDPQTAGGLLLAVAEDRAKNVLAELRANYPRADVIGRLTKRGMKAIQVI